MSFYIFVLLFLILARANKNTRAQNPALPPFAKSWRGGPGPPTLTGGPGADRRRARARARARALSLGNFLVDAMKHAELCIADFSRIFFIDAEKVAFRTDPYRI